MVLQDASGSLNPRQTVYESVAEGIRLHRRVAADPEGRTEADLVAAALAEAGLRPPERLFLRYPHELSGGQRQRVLIAGCARAAAAAADRRRAGLVPGRLDPRRDPGAAAAACARPRARRRGGHPRPRAGLEHRRPDRGDVPRPRRRVRHHRGGAARRRSTPTPGRCCRSCPRSSGSSRSCSSGEIPDPTRIPGGCRFHPRCPALADGTAEAAGVAERCRTDAARRCSRRPGTTVRPATWCG